MGKPAYFRIDRAGNVYAGWKDSSNIEKRSVAGSLLGRISYEQAAVPVTLSDTATELEGMSRVAKRIVRDFDLPSALPAHEIFVVDDSSVWLQEGLTSVAMDLLATWKVVDAEGHLLAQTTVPVRETLKTVYAYGTGHQANGTPNCCHLQQRMAGVSGSVHLADLWYRLRLLSCAWAEHSRMRYQPANEGRWNWELGRDQVDLDGQKLHIFNTLGSVN